MGTAFSIDPASLGSAAFRREHGVRYAYVAGAMYKGIGSKELVIRMGKAGLLGFLGTGGLGLGRVESDIRSIQASLGPGPAWGMNLLAQQADPALEESTVELFLRTGVPCAEAAAYMQMTPSLVRYRATGLERRGDGTIHAPRRLLAKVSRPEIALHFLPPAPPPILQSLRDAGKISPQEAELAASVPMAQDVCVESDSGGHTDQGVALVLVPSMLRLRDEVQRRLEYASAPRVGSAGGLGTPEAVAAAFLLGADFVLTGSINQCSVESGTSDRVKEMLQGADVQDTAIAPAGDLFEMGAKIQVLRKGLFFPARAAKLHEIYRQHESWESVDEKTRRQVETRYFGRTFGDVWEETRRYYEKELPEELARAERSPRQKMALVFRWYFVQSSRWAMAGDPDHVVDYQVHCGPALGAFNRWVRGTPLESWRARHVDDMAERLMVGAARHLSDRLARLVRDSRGAAAT